MGAKRSAGVEYEPIRRSTVKQHSIFLIKQWAFTADCPFSLETSEEQVLPLCRVCGIKSIHTAFYSPVILFSFAVKVSVREQTQWGKSPTLLMQNLPIFTSFPYYHLLDFPVARQGIKHSNMPVSEKEHSAPALQEGCM